MDTSSNNNDINNYPIKISLFTQQNAYWTLYNMNMINS